MGFPRDRTALPVVALAGLLFLLTLSLLLLEPSLTLLTAVLTFFVGIGAIFPIAYVSLFNRNQDVDIPIQRR